MTPISSHIFIDTNVIIGYFLGFEEDKRCLSYLFKIKGKKLYISSLTIAQMVAIFQKQKENYSNVRKKVELLLKKFNVVTFSKEDIEKAITLGEFDMEDNMQCTMALKMRCNYVITNNMKDFTKYISVIALEPTKVRGEIKK